MDLFLNLYRKAAVAEEIIQANKRSLEEQLAALRFNYPDCGMEYTLLSRIWPVARRERGSIPAAGCDRASNEATG